MEFSDAAAYFDTESVYDGYTGTFLFTAQLLAFNEHTSDGATVRRRVMQHDPAYDIPLRKAVAIHGQRWLCGALLVDGFGDEVVRKGYSMKQCDSTMAILTPAQACAGAVGTMAYMQRLYYRDQTNMLTDSQIDTFWNIFSAPDEPVTRGSILRDQTGLHFRVRGQYLPAEGLFVNQSDQFDDGLVTLTFDSGAYNPVTETYAAGTTNVFGLWLDLPKLFDYRIKLEQDGIAGDRAVLIAKTYTPQVGVTFTMQGAKWRVLQYLTELDAWALHVRRV